MARKNLLRGFKRPRGITFERSQVGDHSGRFVAYPFERGYGTTIGNTLRRVLLSSMQGYAVTAVRITSYDEDDTPHLISSEFEPIPEVVEDTPEIINNLKHLQIRLPGDLYQKVVTVECKGPGDFCGGDLEKYSDVEIINKELRIATLMEKAKFDIEIQVDLGRGYVPAELNEKYIETTGTIPLDAIFSPIKRVKYEVENCRVGQRGDYDKLIMEVTTNGVIKPDDAVAEASKIIKEQFSSFINFEEDGFNGDEEIDEKEERIRAVLNIPVDELELSVRSSNCLKNANIKSVGDLTRKTEDDIAKTRNFGKKSLQEIKGKLSEWNLTLGMTDYSQVSVSKKFQAKKEEENET